VAKAAVTAAGKPSPSGGVEEEDDPDFLLFEAADVVVADIVN
jgi:hypothetical protein